MKQNQNLVHTLIDAITKHFLGDPISFQKLYFAKYTQKRSFKLSYHDCSKYGSNSFSFQNYKFKRQ